MNYKLQKSYGEDGTILIDETELVSAIRAMITGKIALLKSGVVSGNHIISIVPDYNSALKTYNPNGPDYLSPVEQQKYLDALEDASEIARAEQENRQPRLLEKPENPSVKIYTKEPTALKDLLPRP